MLLKPFAVVALFVAGSLAFPEITDEIRKEFQMGLFPRVVSNLQAFSGALGGAQASAITDSGNPDRPFAVDGDTFNDFKTAANRACDNQHNNCAQLANSKSVSFAVGACDDQSDKCKAAIGAATATAFASLQSSDPNFDFICED